MLTARRYGPPAAWEEYRNQMNISPFDFDFSADGDPYISSARRHFADALKAWSARVHCRRSLNQLKARLRFSACRPKYAANPSEESACYSKRNWPPAPAPHPSPPPPRAPAAAPPPGRAPGGPPPRPPPAPRRRHSEAAPSLTELAWFGVTGSPSHAMRTPQSPANRKRCDSRRNFLRTFFSLPGA